MKNNDLDFTTGLPELPKFPNFDSEYMWRVGPGQGVFDIGWECYYGFGISLNLRSAPGWFGRQKVKCLFRSPIINGVPTTEAVREEARKLLWQLQIATDKEAEILRLSGDYPPKKVMK